MKHFIKSIGIIYLIFSSYILQATEGDNEISLPTISPREYIEDISSQDKVEEIKIVPVTEQQEEREPPFFHSLSVNSDDTLLEIVNEINADTIDPERGPLYAYIQRYLIEKEEISESHLKKFFRKSSPFFSFALGGITGAAFYQTGYSSGRGHKIWSYTMAILYTAICAEDAVWSYFNVVKSLLEPKSPEEKNMLKKNKSTAIAPQIAAHMIGIFPAVPSAYITYKYNKYKELALIMYAYAYCFYTIGLKIFFDETINKYSQQEEKSDESKNINDFRTYITNYLSTHTIPCLLTLTEPERNLYLQQLSQVKNPETYLQHLLSLSLSEDCQKQDPNTWKGGYPKYLLTRAVLILPFMTAAMNGYFSYRGWSLLFESNYLIIPLTLTSVIPSLSLDLKATLGTCNSVYDSIFHQCWGRTTPSVDQVIYPKISKVIPSISIISGLVLAYVCQFVDYDSLREITSEQTATILSLGGVATWFFFGIYANRSLTKDLMQLYARFFAQENERLLARTINGLERLSRVLEQTKEEELKKFIDHPPLKELITSIKFPKAEEDSLPMPQENQEEIELQEIYTFSASASIPVEEEIISPPSSPYASWSSWLRQFSLFFSILSFVALFF